MTGPAEASGDKHSSLLSAANLGEAARKAGELLHNAGIATARLDARVLTCRAFDLSFEDLLLRSDDPADMTALGLLSGFCARRAVGEPVARILGAKEFWSLEFDLNEATLVPRPETELCVETGLELLRGAGIAAPRILDLGTGCGCILISLLHELPDATGLGIDLAKEAIEIARINADKLRVAGRAKFEQKSWEGDSEFMPPFDLIVTNPPYIPAGDIHGLEPEVRDFDPVLALAGGEDGLDSYRRIADRVPDWLSPGGFLVAEIGDGQAADVAGLFEAAGFFLVADWQRFDLAGKARVVAVKKR